MSRNDYRAITLPEGLYARLEQYVKYSNGFYVSVTEVVREALREFLRQDLEEKLQPAT
jgi:Arc/MetJ-type ribon-helix-helix transcriptional regulator